MMGYRETTISISAQVIQEAREEEFIMSFSVDVS